MSHLYLDMESGNHSTAELTVFNATKSNIVPLENDMHLKGKSGTIHVNGVELYYERYGNGPHAILCMPGALGGTLSFVPQINYFGRSGSGYTFITYDPRGYGRSKSSTRVYSSPLYYNIDAKDAVGLMNALGFKEYSLMGWCEGGTCAIITAATFPDAIQSLVVWGPHVYLQKTDLELFHKLNNIETWEPKARATLEKYYGEELPLLWRKWFDGFISVYNDPVRQGDICKREVREIQCPTLVLHGEEDQLIPFYQVEFLRNNLQNYQCEIIQGGKHSLHFKSSSFNNIIDKFLTTHNTKVC